MSSQPPSRVEQITAFLRRTKAVLSKDYSAQDLKDWLSGKLGASPAVAHAASELSSSSSTSASAVAGQGMHLPRVALTNLPRTIYDALLRHRIGFALLGAASSFIVISVLWLVPLRDQWQTALELRPVQWAHLQHLVKLSKTHAVSSGAAPLSSSSAMTFALLDDAELQKLRAILSARDIKPNVLRLTADNPPRLELQANEVLFSEWIELQDELRQVWRLYPETVSVIATATPGLVQISSTLKQALPASSPAGRMP